MQLSSLLLLCLCSAQKGTTWAEVIYIKQACKGQAALSLLTFFKRGKNLPMWEIRGRQIIHPCEAGQPLRGINLETIIHLLHELGQLAPGVLFSLSAKTGIKLAFAKIRIYSCYKTDSEYNSESENCYWVLWNAGNPKLGTLYTWQAILCAIITSVSLLHRPLTSY